MSDGEATGKRKRMTWGLSSIALFDLAGVLPILWIMFEANIPEMVSMAIILAAAGAPICGTLTAIVGLFRDRRWYVSVIGMVLNVVVVGFWCYWGFAFWIILNPAT